MYIYLKNEVKCGECGSRDVAKTIPKTPYHPGRFVCLSCGHKEKKLEYDTIIDGNAWTYQEKETVF
ncbi:hypothetical protein KAR91_10345 [Candidatus Pacearchaeota archaeon]|nr:hypothetical protein [Candidatus Pacearchaeota archaeon]